MKKPRLTVIILFLLFFLSIILKAEAADDLTAYQQALAAYNASKDQLQTSTTGVDLKLTKQYAEDSVNLVIEYINTLRSELDSQSSLDEATKNTLKNGLENDSLAVQKVKDELGGTIEVAQVQEKLNELSTTWSSIRQKSNSIEGLTKVAKISRSIDQIVSIKNKINNQLNTGSRQDQRSEETTSLLNEIDQNLAKAQSERNEAEKMFRSISEDPNSSDMLYEEGLKKAESATILIKQSYNNLLKVQNLFLSE